MKLKNVSPEAEAVLELPFTAADAEACESFVDRFECTTTALYLIAAHLAAEHGDDEGAEIIADAVVKLAEHEAKNR